MKVSINWLKELVNLQVPLDELIRLLPLRTIGLKDVTDQTIELDMKGYNRADLLSMRGVAYEAAAITNSEITFSDEQPEINTKNPASLNVSVENPALCPMYCLAKIEGLKVAPSAKNWQDKLTSCGMRSVNNIADVTNLCMMEYGQPLHAFDAAKVKGDTIIVRTARSGEKIETLDGKNRSLAITDLLITDTDKVLGIAGVMGGKTSEITDATTSVLLEAAIFDPKSLRQTAIRLGLQSEASKRFYHGLTKRRLLQAFNAAIKMYERCGGQVRALTLIGDYKTVQHPIRLNFPYVKSLIGVEIAKSQVAEYLSRLHFSVKEISSEDWEVTAPHFRLDIEFPEDLIEEVARMYGYEKIPPKKLPGEIPFRIDQTKFKSIYSMRQTLVEMGLTEIQTYSFFSTAILNTLSLDKQSLIRVANPISSETEYLRNNLWPNTLETVIYNHKQGFPDIAVFEIGKTYQINNGQPKESYHLAIGVMNGTDNPIQELNRIFQQLNGKLKLGIDITDTNLESSSLFHPNRQVNLVKEARVVGQMAEVHPRIANQLGNDKIVAILELTI